MLYTQVQYLLLHSLDLKKCTGEAGRIFICYNSIKNMYFISLSISIYLSLNCHFFLQTAFFLKLKRIFFFINIMFCILAIINFQTYRKLIKMAEFVFILAIRLLRRPGQGRSPTPDSTATTPSSVRIKSIKDLFSRSVAGCLPKILEDKEVQFNF